MVDNAHIAGLGRDDRRTELLRAKGFDVLADRVTELESDTAVTAWTALPTYGAQWSNYGGGWSTGAYRKVGDEVQIRGLLQRGSAAPSATICTMPVGFRPVENYLFPCMGYVFGANQALRITVTAGGSLDLDTINNVYYTLSPYYAPIGTNAITYVDISTIRYSTV